MAREHPSPDLELNEAALLQHLPWLRGLARRLASDPDSAEDAVQDTVLAALRRPPPRVRSVRGWLGGTLRHGLARTQQGERARRHREGVVASKRGAAPAVDAAVAEIEAYQNLLAAIRALAEPYRSTLMCRFAKEQTPAEIAQAMGVPLKTVHTRIRRGLERLRAALDARYRRRGGIAAFGAAVGVSAPHGIPPCGGPPAHSLPLPFLMGIAMQTKAILFSLAVCLLCGLAWLWSLDGSGGQAPAGVPAGPTQVAAGGSGSTPTVPEIERTPVLPPTDGLEVSVVPPGPSVAEPGPMVDGVVFRLDGKPMAGVELGFERLAGDRYLLDPQVPTAVADGQGRFRLPLPRDRGRVTVLGPRFACAVHGILSGAEPPGPLTLVVAPAGRVTGRVVDGSAGGRPLAGAEVAVVPPARDVEVLAPGLRVIPVPPTLAERRTGDDGSFDCGKVAWVPGSVLTVKRDGYAAEVRPLEAPESLDLRVVLDRRRDDGDAIHGVVLDGDGRPVERAMVSVGERGVETDAEGRFRLPGRPGSHPGGELRAAKVGLGVTSIPLRSIDPVGGAVLVLSGESVCSIHGSVVDAGGAPVPGAVVWTPDTSFFGSMPLPHNARTSVGLRTVEGFLADGAPTDWSHGTTADARGRFALGHLMGRPYAVFALDPRTMAAVGPVTVHPAPGGGADVALQLPREGMVVVAGRLLDPEGQPIPGARLRVGRQMAWQRPEREPDPWGAAPVVPPQASRLLPQPRTATDDAGRFRIGPIATAGVYLSAEHPALLHRERIRLDSVPDPTEIRWAVGVRSTFCVQLDDPGEADAFGIQTPSGGRAPLFLPVEDLVLSVPTVELVQGRSPEVYSRAREVVLTLYRDGQEVRRRQIRLPPGGVHRLRP